MKYKVTKTNAFANSDIFNAETGCELFTIDGDFYVSGAESQAQANALMAAHHPILVVLTPAEKLFNATGLTVAEYKALGL